MSRHRHHHRRSWSAAEMKGHRSSRGRKFAAKMRGKLKHHVGWNRWKQAKRSRAFNLKRANGKNPRG